jgi:hypothetical protein
MKSYYNYKHHHRLLAVDGLRCELIFDKSSGGGLPPFDGPDRPVRGPDGLADRGVAELGVIPEFGDEFADVVAIADVVRIRGRGPSRLEREGCEMMSARGQLPSGGGETPWDGSCFMTGATAG